MQRCSPGPESVVCQLLAWERGVLERQASGLPDAPNPIGLPLVTDAVRRARLQDIEDQQHQLGCLGLP